MNKFLNSTDDAKMQVKSYPALTYEEIGKLFDYLERQTANTDTTRALIVNLKTELLVKITYTYAMRESEAVSIKRKTINFDAGEITIKANKRGFVKDYSLSILLIELIKRYLTITPESEWLFPGQDPDKHLTRQSFYYRFRDACVSCGLRYHNPHILRHSRLSHLANRQGETPLMVQHFARQKSAKSTECYLHPEQNHKEKSNES